MAEVICVGSAVLDHVFDVPALATGAGTLFASAYRQAGAGTAANAAVAASRLGGSAALWTQLGDDDSGDLIVADLVRYAVDVAGTRRVAGAQSPLSGVVAAPDGQRQVFRFDGVGLPRETGWLPLGRIADTGAVLAEPAWPEGAQTTLAAAREHHRPGVLAVGVAPVPVAPELARCASWILFSPPELIRFTGVDDRDIALPAAAEAAQAHIGVTTGSDGLHWCAPGEPPRTTPPLTTECVDPAGTWDAFAGAFALALGEEKPLDTAIAFAITAAGLTGAAAGARRAMPDRRTVWQRLAAAFPDVADSDG